MSDFAKFETERNPRIGGSTRVGTVASSRATPPEPPREAGNTSRDERKYSFFFMTCVYSVFFIFLSFTFPLYFYFAPNFSNSDVRPALLVIYLIMWPIGIIVPVVLLWLRNITSWSVAMSSVYLVAVLGWPVVTILIKIRSLIAYGDAGIGYWGLYPVFILLELLWPIFAVVVWAIMRRSVSTTVKIKREMRREFKEELRSRIGERA